MNLSVSAVQAAHQSALSYYHRYVLKIKEEPTQAQKDGTMVHLLILEPEKFYAKHFTDQEFPEGHLVLKLNDDLKSFLADHDIKGKGNKPELIAQVTALIAEKQLDKVIIYDHWMETHTAGREYVSKVKWDRLHTMRDRVLKHRFVKKYLPMGHKEVSFEEELFGHMIRGRADWVVDDPELPWVLVIDVKKAKSAHPRAFGYAIRDNGLGIQGALYTAAFEKKYGRPCMYVWLAVEDNPPHHCEAYSPNEADLEAYTVLTRQALKRIEDGHRTEEWPGYSDGNVQSIGMSSWEFDKVAEIEMMLGDER